MAKLTKGWDSCDTVGCNNKMQFRLGHALSNNCEACDSLLAELVPCGWDSAICRGYPKRKIDMFVVEFENKGTNGKNRRVELKFGETVWVDLGIEDEVDPRKHLDPRPDARAKMAEQRQKLVTSTRS